ncbi:restriction endonuclease subunit S [Enterococcus durans]|uniref:restriction endonuclease subunit S n=1 Tax=Enterococcus durans TaxID=53345 RepID=UPI003EC0B105
MYAWEQRKLDEIFGKISNAFVGTATPYYVDEGHFYLESNNVKDGRINRNTEVFINDEFYEKQKDKWLHTNDIVMVQSGHVGHTAVIPEDLDKTAAHALIMFSNYKTKTSPFFLNYQFQTLTAKRKLENITTGNTIKHILASEMKKFEVTIPEHVEQQKIGSFFKQLDDTLALHQDKLNKLKRLKKGFLQVLFANKTTSPKVRFAKFNEEWEQRKLGELAESFEYGLNASAKKFDGSNKYIRITDIDDISHKFNQSGVTSPDIDFANADNYKLKKGDILFARTGASVGKTYIYRESDGLVYYAGFLIRARIKSKISSEFVFQTTFNDSYNQFIKITSQRSGQPGVNAEEYSNFKIMIPNYEEQNAIGCFFKKVDDTITLNQKKISSLKQLKKAFLQLMFI